MSREEFYYESSDNITKIHACIWIPDDKQPKGIIQMAHGVTEYILRYEEFAKYFTSKGYIVVGNDHIGHGLSVAEGREKIFAPNKTEYDWLCANEEALREYIDDPLRGGDFSAGLFREMLNGMLYTSKINNIQKMNKDIKILLISGQKDPVGNCGKGVIKTYKAFKKAGINNISLKLMPNDRHDILHEKDKLDVYNIIYKFCIDD